MKVYLDWEGLLVNPRFCRNGGRVAWSNYDVGIIREPITHEKVRSLVEGKQYTFQSAEDGSVFQLLYEFDESQQLKLARLAFYKISGIENDSEVVDGPKPEAEDQILPWLRFDFTEEYARGVLHYRSHLHLGGFKDARLVVAGVPGPHQFIELVVTMCYPDYYRVHRLDENGRFSAGANLSEVNLCCRDAFNEEEESSIIHVRLP